MLSAHSTHGERPMRTITSRVLNSIAYPARRRTQYQLVYVSADGGVQGSVRFRSRDEANRAGVELGRMGMGYTIYATRRA